MFIEFFYLLRSRGLNVSLNEWMTLIKALDKGLCYSNFSNFYYLCRMILIKSESDFDKFDAVFLEYFKGIEHQEEIPEEIMNWLKKPDIDLEEFERLEQNPNINLDKLRAKLEERIKEQDSPHNGGNYWIGTGGTSELGHSGKGQTGIRIGGNSTYGRAVLEVAGERKYRDFRDDEVLNMRQFQVALKRLRQFSTRIDAPKTELDLDKTIEETCNNAGYLKLFFEKPRKNTVKLLLLMDSGGSMRGYSTLCNTLFQSVSKSNHFKDVKIYYFHNCIYDRLFTTPECWLSKSINTEWILKNIDKNYKVIIVGDASMSPSELLHIGGNYRGPYNYTPGIEWLKRFKRKYSKIVWMNPELRDGWDSINYWYQTQRMIQSEFNMFPLTVKGLEKALKNLMVSR
ncbi:TPA: VWA domain-containing protein [Clostridioides difficile]|nr:VWA domain-containing protein [Clostridioides difficile]HBE9762532.1 VWA domain-containing protein [Clostridioides difficile]HBE9786132.1 VWA domain-containing protein [Clostridioides difficile]